MMTKGCVNKYKIPFLHCKVTEINAALKLILELMHKFMFYYE